MAKDIVSGIYKINNSATGKCYVGSAVSLKKRLYLHRYHLEKNQHTNVKLQRAWTKHGADSFEISILEFVADKSCLIAREQWWIDQENCAEFGYNIAPTAGSSLGTRHTDEAKEKMSLAKLGKTHSAETRAKLSILRRRENLSAETLTKMSSTSKSRTISAETRKQMAMTRTGKPRSATTKAKISLSLTGKTASNETKRKRSLSMTGLKRGPRTLEHTERWRASHAKTIAMKNIENTKKRAQHEPH